MYCPFARFVMEKKQSQSLLLALTLLNMYYSILRVNRTALPEVAVLCEVMEELLAPRFIWVKGVYRWPNKDIAIKPDGSKGLSQAGVSHHWLVLRENPNIIVDVSPVLALKDFETPLVVEQQSGSDSRMFIGYFPHRDQSSTNVTTVTLNTVRVHMDELLRKIKIS